MIKHKIAFVIIIFILAIALVGCINMKTSIKLKKDGSGSIEQTFLLSNAVASMMNSNPEKKTDDESAAAPDMSAQLMDKDKLAAYAKEMGEGVVLVSVTPFSEGEFSGYKAVYSFKDINKVKINQNPAELMPSGTSGGATSTSTEKEYLTFSYAQGGPNSLVIRMPALDKSKTKKSTDETEAQGMDESTISMMKEIYKDMKINIQVEIPGIITQSNAVYKTNSIVTLIDIDFNKILNDEKSFNTLVKGNAESIEDMKVLVKNVKGLRMELQPAVNVYFN
jgi:hypothetical protein